MLWRAIREDLDSLESVSDVLRVLDVVIGFLSSAGGDPEQRVSSYLYDTLKYPHGVQGSGPLLSKRVNIFLFSYCMTDHVSIYIFSQMQAVRVLRLKHILSFRRLLSIENARLKSKAGQVCELLSMYLL